MGLGLSHPVSSKVLHRKGNKNFRVGAATMHGWRETMEDAHSIVLSMSSHPNTAFFGIFDGHSGALCSKYVAEHLPPNLDQLEGHDLDAIRKVVIQTDQTFLDSDEYRNKEDGSAGIFTLARADSETGTYHLINGNIGDSRIVLGRKQDDSYTAIPCSFDHKPTNEEERKRIEAAGGHVSLARVDGQLALSRAFGDRMLKRPLELPPEQRKVTSNPDFIEEKATKDDFLFLACDGIYEGDIFSRETAIAWLAEKLKDSDDLAMICAQILDECLHRGSRDNMSCMIVQLKDGSDYERENEYIPGPWYSEEGDSKFQEAYTKDADAAGYTLEAALQLRHKQESEKINNITNTPAGHESHEETQSVN